jgi:5-methylcytosine-specific restriction protein A
MLRDAGQDRRSARARGYDSAWDKESRGYRELHPWCRPCEQQGRATLATQVDHIIPHNGDMTLFWDMDNWQPICRPCHDAKSAREAQQRNKHPGEG